MKIYNIYTDGSHLKHTTGRLGIGGIFVEPPFTKIDTFSQEVSIDYLKRNYGTSDVSNPTCEMLAVLFALKQFRKLLKRADEVHIKADYQGVKEWLDGNWKTKAPYIAKIKEEIENEIQSQKLQGRIHFDWVKGHQNKSVLDPDAFWNNKVDLLAKGVEDDE